MPITVKGLISRSLAFHEKEMSALTLPPGKSEDKNPEDKFYQTLLS